MNTRTYHLRSRTVTTDYRCSPPQPVNYAKLVTEAYNTPEKIGKVDDIEQIVHLRFPNNKSDENIKSFLHTYKNYFHQFSEIIEDMNEHPCPEDKERKHQYLTIKHQQIHSLISEYFRKTYVTYKNVDITEDNLDEYIRCIRYSILIRDWILLAMKIQVVNFGRAKQDILNLYYSVCDFDKNFIQKKYKEYKERQYDRQKVALLYTTKLPTDVCKYVIKEFL